MASSVRWALAVLAGFRLIWMMKFSDGPFELLLELRIWAGVYDLGPTGEPETAAGRYLSCPYCLALPCGLIGLLALFPSLPGDILLAWLGIAGAITLLIRWRNWE